MFNGDHPNFLFLCSLTDRIKEELAKIDFTFPRDLRHMLSSSSFDQATEHYRSIAILVQEGAFGSAAALLRCQFECYVRSVWTYYCATDEELTELKGDKALESRKLTKLEKKKNKIFVEYIKEIGDVRQEIGSSLGEHHSQLWSTLNSYTHGGALSMLRKVKGDRIQENYGKDDIEQAAHLANFYQIEALDHAVIIGKNEKAKTLVDRFRMEFSMINGIDAPGNTKCESEQSSGAVT